MEHDIFFNNQGRYTRHSRTLYRNMKYQHQRGTHFNYHCNLYQQSNKNYKPTCEPMK